MILVSKYEASPTNDHNFWCLLTETFFSDLIIQTCFFNGGIDFYETTLTVVK